MDYKAIWNEICFHVNKNRNAEENNFQTTIEFMLEKLGWSLYKGEIVSKLPVPIGSAKNVYPDIVIKQDEKMIYVIELKRANVNFTERNKYQIKSYMRQLKLDFGILLGESLHVYFEKPSDINSPIKVCDIKFNDNSEVGIECIEIISKNGYSFERFEDFCNKCLENPDKYNEKIIKPKIQNKEKMNTNIGEPSDAYPCKGIDAFKILCDPDNISLYKGKLRQLYGKKLYIGTRGKKDTSEIGKRQGIYKFLDEMSKNDIDGWDVYLHHTTFDDENQNRPKSWMDGEEAKEIYIAKSLR